jgi:hypothetical protein
VLVEILAFQISRSRTEKQEFGKHYNTVFEYRKDSEDVKNNEGEGR